MQQSKKWPRYVVSLLAMTVLLFLAAAAYAKTFDYGSFKNIPVLHQGRLKPLDSFARIKLKELSGGEQNADAWLAETLFNPASATQRPIFLIDNNTKMRLGLPVGKKLFSFAELQTPLRSTEKQVIPLLVTKPDKLTVEQKQLLQLHENALGYSKLLHSFSLIMPLDLEESKSDYLGLFSKEAALMEKLRALIKRKGENPATYTEEEKRLAETIFGLQQIRAGGKGSDEFKIIPLENEEYASPWQIVLEGHGTPEAAGLIRTWKAMTKAYRNNDAASWNESIREILRQEAGHYSPAKFKLEILYNFLKPFHTALALYILSAAFLVALLFRKSQLLRICSGLCLSLGFAAHALAILSRILILNRPPVGTLYEAALFVSLVCAALGLAGYVRRKNIATLMASLITASVLLAIAPALLQQGENMEMLVAVLNTNFWLSTHVLCITTGYGICLLAGSLAHIMMAVRIRNLSSPLVITLYKNLYVLSLAALLFTAAGTALGGIWADQSWGRFWGWDPKENGALLIVLWLLWLQHGRVAGKIGSLLFATGLAFLNVVVALAWFGVNLLNIGLHSYGFTEGIALGLTLFCALEIFCIGLLFFLNQKQENHAV